MVKSKNHTNHNQSAKNHKNGIKRIMRTRYRSSKGMNQVYLKNRRRARRFDPSIMKEKNLASKIDVQRKNKEKIQKKIMERIEKQKQARLAKKIEKPKKKKKRSKKSKKAKK